ncbi:aldo/keto reductase [Angustibacter sp. McL0619]|uniref:aldo/keto reductase n=1 Tax=Angustibacter sp. McL0619 TaxID=3415676 RepID=UPI003CF215C2
MTSRPLTTPAAKAPPRHLGPLVTSAIGFGCMGLSQGYGPVDDTESTATVHAALDAGVTLFDTAMSYGAGHNERLLGAALRSSGVDRTTVQVASKFGIVRGDTGVYLDAHPDRVAGYCEDSLRRLGVDYLDLYYLHRVDPGVPIEESIGAMAELVQAGKVRWLGVSEVSVEQLLKAHTVHRLAAVQTEWSLMWRQPEDDVIPIARALGMGLVPYSPLGRGLLGGGLDVGTMTASPFRANDPRFGVDHVPANLAQVEALTSLAGQWGVSTAQLSLAWLLAQGADVVPIPGTRRAERARENASASELLLDPARLAEMDREAPPGSWAGDRASFAVPVTARASS